MKRIATVGAVVLAFSLGVPLAGAAPAPVASLPGRVAPQATPAKEMHRAALGEVSKAANNANTNALQTEAIPAGGTVFVPINPFRAIDSRAYPDGYLLAGEVWWFDVLTNEQSVPQIPATAVAITYNLTVTDTSGGAGFLGIYPANMSWPGSSSINWTADGTTLANGGTVAIGFYDAPGQVEIYQGPAPRPGGTDFLLDVTGYYLPAS